MSNGALKTSPLHEKHVALGAKMADFGGWEMPIEYPGGGVVREHTAVRTSVGGVRRLTPRQGLVHGPGAKDFVNACLANDLNRIEPGKAQYTLCCNESGGVVDDLIAYLRSDDDVFLIPNAANTAAVVERLQAAAPEGIEVENLHEGYGVIAVQGPRATRCSRAWGSPRAMNHVLRRDAVAGPPGHRVPHRLHGGARLRAGAGVGCRRRALGRPARRAASPTAGCPAASAPATRCAPRWGTPSTATSSAPDITPGAGAGRLGRGLEEGRLLGAGGPDGREGRGPRPGGLGAARTGRGIPRAHCAVLADGERVGEVTSGTFSPTLRNGIALALLAPSVTEGDEVVVDVRGREVPARVVRPPFVEVGVRESAEAGGRMPDHTYRAQLQWTGSTGCGYRGYPRAHSAATAGGGRFRAQRRPALPGVTPT